MEKNWFTIKELSEKLLVSRSFIKREIDRKVLKSSVWINGNIIIYEKDLTEYLIKKGIKL